MRQAGRGHGRAYKLRPESFGGLPCCARDGDAVWLCRPAQHGGVGKCLCRQAGDQRGGVLAKDDTVSADRERIRAGLATLTEMSGLMGLVDRTPGHESIKPFVLVQATGGTWQVISSPGE